ncbi:unnamed protein product [Moneuplotes crassus]|uniref:Ankyrin repeat domain-containing protein n=1 Tax=Euplotes crassus TaxID=5936 RepID=A0AAD2D4F6_EUPCR|nr:unnamed protein product [Moneuplotes crassus]
MQPKFDPRMNLTNRKDRLKVELKKIIEQRTYDDLDKFLTSFQDEIAKYNLLNEPADNKHGVPIHFACKEDEDDVSAIRLLYTYGADLNKPDRGGRSLIHIACVRNCLNIVKFLLEKNVDIDLKNPVFGSTPLAIAVQNGHYELTKYLLERGADFLHEHNKSTVSQLANYQENDDVTKIVKEYVTKDANWKRRRGLLYMYMKKTPLSKLRKYLFRRVIQYA